MDVGNRQRKALNFDGNAEDDMYFRVRLMQVDEEELGSVVQNLKWTQKNVDTTVDT
jgi:hypothetical protein